MSPLAIVGQILYAVLFLFLVSLWGRFILDLVRSLNRSWRPRGVVLVLADVTYRITDPPLSRLRRLLPPIRLGGVALDFAWSILLIAVIILMSVVSALR